MNICSLYDQFTFSFYENEIPLFSIIPFKWHLWVWDKLLSSLGWCLQQLFSCMPRYFYTRLTVRCLLHFSHKKSCAIAEKLHDVFCRSVISFNSTSSSSNGVLYYRHRMMSYATLMHNIARQKLQCLILWPHYLHISLTRKIVSEMTYIVSRGTLNPTIPLFAESLIRIRILSDALFKK